jgi:hypothetical protein
MELFMVERVHIYKLVDSNSVVGRYFDLFDHGETRSKLA